MKIITKYQSLKKEREMTYYAALQERLNSITNPVKPMRPKVPGIDSSSCEFLAYSNELAKHEELEQNYKKELKEFEILRQLAYSDFKKSHRSDYPELSEKQFDLVYDKVRSESECIIMVTISKN